MTEKITKSFRMDRFEIKMLEYIAEKTGMNKTQVISRLLGDAIFGNETILTKKGETIKLSKEEFKAEYLLDKSSD